MRLRRSTVADRRNRESVRRRLERVIDRQQAIERDLELLETTLKAVAKEGELSISGPCGKCGQSLLFIRDQELFCPQCDFRRSL